MLCKKLISEKLSLAGKQLTRGDLEGLLKAAADLIRTRVDYTFILVLLFYKRISDKWKMEFENAYKEALADGLTEEEAKKEAKNAIYHDFDIPEELLWENIRKEPARLPENFSKAMKVLAERNCPGSELRNPSIASVFYDIGWAEAKGTGLKTTIELLKKDGYPLPEYLNAIRHDTFTLVLPHPIVEITEQVTEQVTNMMDRRAMTLEFCKEPRSLKEIMQFLGLKHRPNFIENVLNSLLKAGLLQRTIPDKPRSRFQRYVAARRG